MFSAIAIAIKQLFAAITVFFAATEKLANATNELSAWAQETAASFADEARIMRIANRTKLLTDNKVSDAVLALASNGGSTVTPKSLKA